jgi:voltage-gated potassium channel
MSEQPPTEAAAPVPPKERASLIGNFRFSMAQFLVALVLLFALTPFVELFKNGDALEGALITLVLVSGVMAVGGRRWKLVVAVMLVLPALVGKWVNLFRPDLLPPEVHLVTGLIFVGFVLLQLLQFILRAPRVNSEVLCAGVAGYLLLGILWMFAYVLVARITDNSFAGTLARQPLQGFDAYYFSFITLATVGYGDITPLTHGARALAMTEAMTGTLYIAVLISRLVALYSSQNLEPPKEKNRHQ